MLGIESRRLGATQLSLPVLGFGAASVGNLYTAVSDDNAIATVHKALALGFGYFDTAPYYGFGLSESRLGTALSHENALPPRPILSSKVGRLLKKVESVTDGVRHGFASNAGYEPYFDYSYDGVMRSFESSLQRLQVSRIPILFAHDLGQKTHGAQHVEQMRVFLNGGYRAMDELRSAGMVDAIGIGANEWQVCRDALQHTDLDCFLLAGRYTLLDQSAAESFFPLCQRKGVSVVLGGAFNSGILASGITPIKHGQPVHYDYEPASANVIARVELLESLCRDFSVPLPAAALQFSAAHPQVTSVVVGLANVAQVSVAVEWMNTVIPHEFWFELIARKLIAEYACIPL